jgi:hypothetical protein
MMDTVKDIIQVNINQYLLEDSAVNHNIQSIQMIMNTSLITIEKRQLANDKFTSLYQWLINYSQQERLSSLLKLCDCPGHSIQEIMKGSEHLDELWNNLLLWKNQGQKLYWTPILLQIFVIHHLDHYLAMNKEEVCTYSL